MFNADIASQSGSACVLFLAVKQVQRNRQHKRNRNASDIEVDRELEAQPEPSQAQKNKKASGEAREDRLDKNAWHAKKAQRHTVMRGVCAAGLEAGAVVASEVVEARVVTQLEAWVEACSMRALLGSLLLGLAVRGWFTRVRVLPDGQEVFEEIPAELAVIPNLADRNMCLQLCLVWMAGIKPQQDLLSQVSNYTISLERYLVTWPAMWAEMSKRRWSNTRFRLYRGKQRTVAKFWAEVSQYVCQLSRELSRELTYGAAGFSGSGSIGSKGVPVNQMRREACKQFPERVVLVHEFRTSRVSSARTNVVQGQAESFSTRKCNFKESEAAKEMAKTDDNVKEFLDKCVKRHKPASTSEPSWSQPAASAEHRGNQADIESLLGKWMYATGSSFRSVEVPEFKDLIHALRPDFIIPTRKKARKFTATWDFEFVEGIVKAFCKRCPRAENNEGASHRAASRDGPAERDGGGRCIYSPSYI
ncbi:hypothetical protein QJQ45_014108 [Haematococcus lacustris]|nr:hypothetical protein QJQ45_014108 [Haematococcus lacustris]